MEKGPRIRVVGGASAEEKEQAKKDIERALFSHFESLSPLEQGEFKKFEYPKSEKELALINFANAETSRLIQEAGIEPYDVPVENFHIVPPELYRTATGRDRGGAAATFTTRQGVIFDAQYFRDNPVYFGAIALHELLHLKAHLSIEVREKNGNVEVTPYREGVTARAAQRHGLHGRYHEHFAGLHEAVVAETEKRLLGKLLDLPELAEEKEWLNSAQTREMRKKFAEIKGISEDDIISPDKMAGSNWQAVSYLEQRSVLNYVCAEIQKQFPDQYQSADEVYKTVLDAHLTGRLLPLSRLVEKTFGKGSFRLLGNMGTDRQSGILHLESLKKARMRQTRQ